MDPADLLKRLEACPPGGDRELDCYVLIARHEIQEALVVCLGDGDDPVGHPVAEWVVLRKTEPPDGGRPVYLKHSPPPYTTSVDAVLEIVRFLGASYEVSGDFGDFAEVSASDATVHLAGELLSSIGSTAALSLLVALFRKPWISEPV